TISMGEPSGIVGQFRSAISPSLWYFKVQIYVSLLTHIQLQIKIMIRYLDVTIGIVLLYIILGIILADLSRSYSINIPLFSVALAVFSQEGYLGAFFAKKRTKYRLI